MKRRNFFYLLLGSLLFWRKKPQKLAIIRDEAPEPPAEYWEAMHRIIKSDQMKFIRDPNPLRFKFVGYPRGYIQVNESGQEIPNSIWNS